MLNANYICVAFYFIEIIYQFILIQIIPALIPDDLNGYIFKNCIKMRQMLIPLVSLTTEMSTHNSISETI